MHPSQFKKKLAALVPSIKDLQKKTLEDLSPEVLALNRQQMNRGETSTGDTLTYQGRSEYSPSYARKKGRSRPIDLNNTGAFQTAMVTTITQTEIQVDSNDSKRDKLVDASGAAIFGLSDESLNELNPQAEQLLIDKIKRRLSL